MSGERERVLETLHAAAGEIQTCDSVEAACERTVTAAEQILEFELCSILLHDDGYLVPVALSSGAPPDGARRVPEDSGLAGKTFQTGESYAIDSVDPETDETDPAKESYRSGLSVPVGDVGVFQAVETVENAFDERDVELAELLVSHTARIIDRLRYERELKEKQAELERQNERLERFVGVISHDLRNPLMVAAGNLDLAREGNDDERLAVVNQAHDRMEQLIEQLLQLAREGRSVEDPGPVELGTLTEQCWELLPTGESRYALDDPPTVLADRDRVRQLLENLLSNAVEHGNDGGDLTVTVGGLSDGDGFYVADDGTGIDPDIHESAFEWGFSTDDGTGFGLAIVREIADAHGWTVRLMESETGGARFECTGVTLVAGEE